MEASRFGKERFLDRVKVLLDLSDELKLPLESAGYTCKEFQRMREEGNPFIREALESSKVLYGMMP